MLGRSYLVLQEYPLALRAYERADRLSGGRNVEALIGEAEALALSDESELDGRAGRLIERRWSSIRTRARRCSSALRWPSGAATCRWPARASPGSWP